MITSLCQYTFLFLLGQTQILLTYKNVNRPTVFLCKTIKGFGVPYIESDSDRYHATKLTSAELKKARTYLR
jgi:pyruvate dehydrogenase complex dehydrogenase (E1) component